MATLFHKNICSKTSFSVIIHALKMNETITYFTESTNFMDKVDLRILPENF